MANMTAEKMYKTVIAALDEREWKYEREDEKLRVTYKVGGEDLPMHFIMWVDEEHELVRLVSPMLVNFPEDKRVEGAIATCYVTNTLANGCFEYDLSDGQTVFRMANTYAGSDITTKVIHYMISVAAKTVDDYNDKFFMLAKGMLSIDDFIGQ